MNYGRTNIFQMTLRNLGISAVEALDPNSGNRNVAILASYYEMARDKVLEDYDWNFASAYRLLTPAINDLVHPKFLYKFDYPNDCLVIREMFLYTERNTGDEAISFYNMRNSHEEENINEIQTHEYEVLVDDSGLKCIFTNIDIPIIRYTRAYTGVEVRGFTPTFAMALSWYLAALTASAITGARVKMSDCLQIYRQMLREAMTTDANESHKKDNYECEWITARD